MAPAPQEMRRLLGKTQNLLIDSACQRLSLCALKLYDRGRLTDGGLRLALAVTRRVRQLLPPASLYWFALPTVLPPLQPPLASEAKLESGTRALVRLRGPMGSGFRVNAASVVTFASEFDTIGAPGSIVTSGVAFYELEVLSLATPTKEAPDAKASATGAFPYNP